jgi:hypothetical protein
MVIQLGEGNAGLFVDAPDTFGRQKYTHLVTQGAIYIYNSSLGGETRIEGTGSIPPDSVILGVQYQFRLDGGTATSWDFYVELGLSSGSVYLCRLTESDLFFSTGMQTIWFNRPIHTGNGGQVFWWFNPVGGVMHIEVLRTGFITARAE